MSRQANPKTIGAFVVGAIVLAVIAVISFGSGQFLTKKRTFVLYFEGSVKGLTAGSPVLFRGVPIGAVTGIRLLYDVETGKSWIPVYIETEPDRIQDLNGVRNQEQVTKELVEKEGLRAQLISLSMITGQLAIQFDFHPGTPINLVGGDTRFPELPTIPSFMEQLTDTIQDLPIKEIAADLQHAIQGIDELVRSPDVNQAIRDLDKALVDVQNLVEHVEGQIDPVVSRIDGTLKDAQALVRNVDGKVEPLTSSFEETLNVTRGALTQAQDTLATVQGLLKEDSPLYYRLDGVLQELSAALHSVRVLADYLEQHPEAVFQGKGVSGGP